MIQALETDFVIQCVNSVSDAYTYLNTLPVPDMLISEVVVNEESGIDLCHYVRTSSSLNHLPIMFLTSRANTQDKVTGFQAGADDYVVKPFDVRHLKARIRLLARIKRLEQRTSA